MNQHQQMFRSLQVLRDVLDEEEFDRREHESSEYIDKHIYPLEFKLKKQKRKMYSGWRPTPKEFNKIKILESEIVKRYRKAEDEIMFEGYEHLLPDKRPLELPGKWWQRVLFRLKWDWWHWKRTVKEWWNK